MLSRGAHAHSLRNMFAWGAASGPAWAPLSQPYSAHIHSSAHQPQQTVQYTYCTRTHTAAATAAHTIWVCRTFREEGFFAFWKGNGVNIIRIFPYSAAQLAANDSYKRVLANEQVCIWGGVCAWGTCGPFHGKGGRPCILMRALPLQPLHHLCRCMPRDAHMQCHNDTCCRRSHATATVLYPPVPCRASSRCRGGCCLARAPA